MRRARQRRRLSPQARNPYVVIERNRTTVSSRNEGSRLLDERTCAALELLENRWALRLLTALVPGPSRFSELEAAVPGVSRRMMTERLRELEGAGVVRRIVDPGPPITSTYSLTDDGQGRAPSTTNGTKVALGASPRVGQGAILSFCEPTDVPRFARDLVMSMTNRRATQVCQTTTM